MAKPGGKLSHRAELPDQGLLPAASWALALVPLLGKGRDTSLCSHVTDEERERSKGAHRGSTGNPRPRRPCCLPALWRNLSRRQILGQGLGSPLARGEPENLPPLLGRWDLPRLPQSSPASQRLPGASTFTQLRVLGVELQARGAPAGVAALSVDTNAAVFTDSGVQLTFVRVCKGKERVMDACSRGSTSCRKSAIFPGVAASGRPHCLLPGAWPN